MNLSMSSNRSFRRESTSKKAKLCGSNHITKPRSIDVLCGRGRGYFDHPGNRRMLSIVAEYKIQYQTACKVEKSSITQKVLEMILEPQGDLDRARFLKKIGSNKGSPWYELSEKEVHKKVAHTLREQKNIVKSRICKREKLGKESSNELEEDTSINSDFEPEPLTATVSLSSQSLPLPSKCMEKDFMNALCTFRNLPPVDIAVPVSDDEDTLKQFSFRKVPEHFFVLEEPLSFQQEPVFNEKEIHSLLHTVLDEDDAEDVILDSFLDGIDLQNSLRSLR